MQLLQIQSQRLALICLVASSLALAGCSPSYERTEHYPTRDDAVRAGAFSRGWLPDWLPASSSEIWESHDQDSNDLYVKFKFEKVELESILKEAHATSIAEKERPQIPTISEPWWPNKLASNHYYLVDHGEGKAVLVLDVETSTIILWNVP
jgi:hypothetical protein